MELFENDNVTIIMCSLPEFYSNTNTHWPVTVAVSNFSAVVWTESIRDAFSE